VCKEREGKKVKCKEVNSSATESEEGKGKSCKITEFLGTQFGFMVIWQRWWGRGRGTGYCMTKR
jgi:hypothetical protein